jgi:hypothetical protein
MASKDTLGHAIAQVMRRTIPEHTLCNVPESDKVLLQNIVHLVQDAIPEVNVTQMELDKSAEQYSIRLPFSARAFTRIHAQSRGAPPNTDVLPCPDIRRARRMQLRRTMGQKDHFRKDLLKKMLATFNSQYE